MTLTERLAEVSTAIAAANYPDAFEHCGLLWGELKVLNRAVNPQEINFVGIPDEAIRRVVDPPYTALAASLDAAHYQGWKLGIDVNWHGYTRQRTLAENKAQFGKLSGLIWHEYAIALDEADLLRDPADRIPDHRKIGAEDGRTLRQMAEEWMTREAIALPASARPPRVTRAELDAARLIVTRRTVR